jgi:Ca-activated chloride channel homolog
MKAGLIFLVAGGVWFSAFFAAGQAQNSGAAVHPARKAYVSPARVVDLNVLVLDHEKQPVNGLDGKRFEVAEDGAAQTIDTVTGAGGPVSLCLVVDESGSTKAMRQPIIDAVVALVKGLPADSEVMVVHFADRAYLDIPFTPVTTVDQAKLRQMESRGGTALYDALVAAEGYVLAKARQKRRALVILSDGGDNASMLDLKEAINRISAPGAPLIYALGFADERDSPSQHYRDEEGLKMLAREAGGVTFNAKNAGEMARRAEEISDMIGSQIVLSYASPEVENSGRWHKLDVRVTGADKREEVHAMWGFTAPMTRP